MQPARMVKSGAIEGWEVANVYPRRDPPPLRFGAALFRIVITPLGWPRRRPCEVGFSPHRDPSRFSIGSGLEKVYHPRNVLSGRRRANKLGRFWIKRRFSSAGAK
jgi:hypothetical protein